jgi:hypothetical protein
MTPHRSRLRLIGCLVGLLLAVSLIIVSARADAKACGKRCHERVAKREAHEKWWRAVQTYGVGLLRARMRCESGSHGGYRLSTTGNSYYFAHQLNIAAWVGAGGRVRGGRPVGVWSTQPERIEQDYRTVRWAAIHGGDAWPHCP